MFYSIYNKLGDIDSITKFYKEKYLEEVQKFIETREGKWRSTRFYWTGNSKHACRVWFKDDKNSYMAVYTESLEDVNK